MTAALNIANLCSLADVLDAALPQTQCKRCGYPDCRAYAEAMAAGEADINRCPPGGAEGVARLAALTGRAARPLDPSCGHEGPLRLALIDETWCIGCTLCIKACPVACIVGAPKAMHTVIAAQCTGCELCVPACPVDCIELHVVREQQTGWQAWSEAQAAQARQRYAFDQQRVRREQREDDERLAARVRRPAAVEPAPTCEPDVAQPSSPHAPPAQADRRQAGTAGSPQANGPEAVKRQRSVIEAAVARARASRADRNA